MSRSGGARWAFLAAGLVYSVGMWREHGPVAVAIILMGALALILIAKGRERAATNVESNGVDSAGSSGSPDD